MDRKIWVAGHNGMVGSAIVRHLEERGERVLKVSRADLDLRDQPSVTGWLIRNKPDIVIFAAAKVGGIHANDTLPADFLSTARTLRILIGSFSSARPVFIRSLRRSRYAKILC
jgi:nucleoside-diphosphate-sugar epimerase